ncbi:DUF1868 domain-containing protein [Novosphingobium sediminicola]
MTTRRRFLEGAALSLVSMNAQDAMGQTTTQTSRPPDVGRKFADDGRVLPFAGNTIICHLPQQGEASQAFDALLDIYRAMPSRDWMRKVTALPPSSYHMTIFGGANDKTRAYPQWPASLPLDMPMDACNAVLAERLKRFRMGKDAGPFHMRVNPDEPPIGETPLTIRLLPADEDTTHRLRHLRDHLSQVTGIREPGHENYRFHITLGYQFAPLTDAEVVAYRADLARWKAELARKVPVIALGAPEYCLLADMFAFKRQFYLR